MITYNGYFPRQKVSSEEKQKQEWYANCIDYVIAAGISFNDRSETETQLNILHGDIPNSFYKKTLNPYNSNNERYTRFPATVRNLDIMNDIVRRYVSEYQKGIHEFIVGANNPEIVLQKETIFAKFGIQKNGTAFTVPFIIVCFMFASRSSNEN